jgi:hypothetical protein
MVIKFIPLLHLVLRAIGIMYNIVAEDNRQLLLWFNMLKFLEKVCKLL